MAWGDKLLAPTDLMAQWLTLWLALWLALWLGSTIIARAPPKSGHPINVLLVLGIYFTRALPTWFRASEFAGYHDCKPVSADT